MAGAFGFDTDRYDLSIAVGERLLRRRDGGPRTSP
jgi:hypothetical protein